MIVEVELAFKKNKGSLEQAIFGEHNTTGMHTCHMTMGWGAVGVLIGRFGSSGSKGYRLRQRQMCPVTLSCVP